MGSHGFTPALVAQRIRASDYGSEGREFDSLQARLKTAQLGSFFLDSCCSSFLSKRFLTIKAGQRPGVMSDSTASSIKTGLAAADPAIAALIEKEQQRQETHL